jgi:sulfur carrier protein
MQVTVDVAGGDTHEVDLPADATYGDCCAAVGLSIHEASVLVDGRPVPEDQPIEADSVTVVRLVKGGARRSPRSTLRR